MDNKNFVYRGWRANGLTVLLLDLLLLGGFIYLIVLGAARLDAVHEAWDAFDHDAVIEQLVRDVEYIDFPSSSYRPGKPVRERHEGLEPRSR